MYYRPSMFKNSNDIRLGLKVNQYTPFITTTNSTSKTIFICSWPRVFCLSGVSSINRFKVTTIDQNRLLSHRMDISRSGQSLPLDFLKYIIIGLIPSICRGYALKFPLAGSLVIDIHNIFYIFV